VASSNGTLYVGGSAGGITRIAAGTHAVSTFIAAGAVPTGGGTFRRATGMAQDAAGNLYITDYANNSVYTVAAGSQTLTTLFHNDGSLNGPHGIAVDAAGNLYVANFNNYQLLKYTVSGSTYSPSPLPVAARSGVVIDGLGNLYLPIRAPGQLSLSEYTRQAPPTTVFPSTSGGASSAPRQIAFENDGNVQMSITGVSASSTLPAAPTTFTQAGSVSPVCGGTLLIAASCNLGEEFTPVGGVPPNTTLTGFGTITDDTLNAPGTVQQAALLGTNGTSLQMINFSPASPILYSPGLQVTLNGSSNSNLPVTYTVTSGNASVTGSVVTFNGPGPVVIAADQAGDANYAAATQVTGVIVAQAISLLSWVPTSNAVVPGRALGTSILDAFAQYVSGQDASSGNSTYTTVPGLVTYTATNTATSVVTPNITSTSALPAGTYILAATFTPTDTTTYTTATGFMTLTLRSGNVFVANSSGAVSAYTSSGAPLQVLTPGGGTGLGINSTGTVHSLSNPLVGASTVSLFTHLNAPDASYGHLNAAGTSSSSGAQALVVDGAGMVWIAQSETEPGSAATAGDIVQFNGGQIMARIAGDASIGTPAGIVVDAAGSLWISSSNNTVVEVIGAASPQETPLVQSLIDGTLATKP
jgi:streptogramin lyase